ncbi:MAG: hypothetical protein PVH12_07595 [Candidatus Bathyarchaeota archaeon]|jgi:hypothetical protein
MKEYTIGCFAPPNALKIDKGNLVEVEGWLKKDYIRAERIQNLTKKGPTCLCGKPKVKKLVPGLPKLVTKKGVVTKVIITGESIEFGLQTDE